MVGVGMTPPKVPGAPKPTSSVMVRSTLGAPLGDTLRTNSHGSLRDFIIAETAPGHWLPWGRLVDAVRRGGAMTNETLGLDPWDYYAKNDDEGRCFARGMSNLSAIVSEAVVHVYVFLFEGFIDIGVE